MITKAEYTSHVKDLTDELIERVSTYDEDPHDAAFEITSGSSFTFNTNDIKVVLEHSENLNEWRNVYDQESFDKMTEENQNNTIAFYALMRDITKNVSMK